MATHLQVVFGICVFIAIAIVYFISVANPIVSPGNTTIKMKQVSNDISYNAGKVTSSELKHLSTSPVRDGTYNYIITQTYGGQMTRGIRNMMLQQCWGASLGHTTYIVEPFLSHSNLYHSSSFWTRLDEGKLHEAAKFSEYYDLQYYNEKSLQDKCLGLVTWENFLKDAPRNSVVLVIPEQSCSLGSTKRVPGVKLLSNCSFTNSFRDFIVGLKKYNFNIVKTVCVHCSQLDSPLDIKELHNEISQAGQGISLLINTGRNFAATSSWLRVPKVCRLSENPSTSTRLRPSLLVVNHSQYYKKTIIGHKHVVALMFRIERFLMQQRSQRTLQNNLTSCVNTALEIHDKVREEKDAGTFLTLDIGRFGSHVMQHSRAVSRLASHGGDTMESITSLAKDTINHIYNGKFTLKTWEETFVEASNGITEMGYIAMLQRNIATEADCLILMGGGSFQQVAAYQYLKNHPEPSSRCLHTVCVTQSFDKSFVDLESVQ